MVFISLPSFNIRATTVGRILFFNFRKKKKKSIFLTVENMILADDLFFLTLVNGTIHT